MFSEKNHVLNVSQGNLSLGFAIRYHTNMIAQLQRQARIQKIWVKFQKLLFIPD